MGTATSRLRADNNGQRENEQLSQTNLQNCAASSAGRDFNDSLCDSLVILTAQSEALLNKLLREETVCDNDPFTHRRLLFLTS
jgi:hypothetical protein